MSKKIDLESIYKRYYEKYIPSFEIYTQIIKHDPTSVIVDDTPVKKGKYSAWLLTQYLKDVSIIHANAQTKAALQIFDKYKKYIRERERDINAYKTLSDLRTCTKYLIDTYGIAPLFCSSKREIIKKMNTDILYEDDIWKIIIPHTHDVFKYYGANTHWCIRKENVFKRYRSNGTLFIAIDKKKKRRYLFQEKRSLIYQCVDENDMPIDIFTHIFSRLSKEGICSVLRKSQHRLIRLFYCANGLQAYHYGNGKYLIVNKDSTYKLAFSGKMKRKNLLKYEYLLYNFLPRAVRTYILKREKRIAHNYLSTTLYEDKRIWLADDKRRTISLFERTGKNTFVEYKGENAVLNYLSITNMYDKRIDVHALYNKLPHRFRKKVFKQFEEKNILPFITLWEGEREKAIFIAPIPITFAKVFQNVLRGKNGIPLLRLDEVYKKRYTAKCYIKRIELL